MKAELIDDKIEIRIETDGNRVKKESEGRNRRDRVIEMRMSAAHSYFATLGGLLKPTTRGYKIELPAVGR